MRFCVSENSVLVLAEGWWVLLSATAFEERFTSWKLLFNISAGSLEMFEKLNIRRAEGERGE